MRSICLVLPYFGKFHNYFPLFLTSCKNNPTIDWLVITDDPQNYNWPENIKVIKSTFTDFKARIQKNFEFTVALEKTYKLCDYRPAYGEILKDELEGYDFWGHCDCDVIFGDIRSFLPDSILDAYDKIFSRGHLTIYRNTTDINSFYRTQSYISYKDVYTNEKSFTFDEWAGISKAAQIARLRVYDELIMDDICTGYDGFYLTKRFFGIGSPYRKYHMDQSKIYKKMKYIVYEYIDGALYRIWLDKNAVKRESVIYAHFQKRKMEVRTQESCNSFIIADNKFSDFVKVTKDNIQRLAGPQHSIKNIYLALRRDAWVVKHHVSQIWRKRQI